MQNVPLSYRWRGWVVVWSTTGEARKKHEEIVRVNVCSYQERPTKEEAEAAANYSVTLFAGMQRSRTKEEARAWFKEQWKLLEERYYDELMNGGLERLRTMFEVLSGSIPPVPSKCIAQKPYSFLLPGLPTTPYYSGEPLPLVQRLEENYEMIKGEMEAVMREDEERLREKDEKAGLAYTTATQGNVGFQVYDGDGVEEDKGLMTGRGEWRVFYFWRQFIEQPENCARCPKTHALLQSLIREGLILGGMVCFSALKPGTHILPHYGPSNMRLTSHLGLVGCEGVTANVGFQERPFVDGKCLVFDDSFMHEVTHRGKQRRVTLMLDLWQPEMTHVEREGFAMVMQNSTLFMPPDEFFHSLNLTKADITEADESSSGSEEKESPAFLL